MPKNFRQSFTPTSYRTLLGVLVLVFVLSSVGILVISRKSIIKAAIDPVTGMELQTAPTQPIPKVVSGAQPYPFGGLYYIGNYSDTTITNPPPEAIGITTYSDSSQSFYIRNTDGTYSHYALDKTTFPDLQTFKKVDGISESAVYSNVQKSQEAIKSADRPGVIRSAFEAALKWLLGIIANLIMWTVSWFVWLSGKLLDVSIKISQDLGYTKYTLVKYGWAATRDLANMFFSLVLLIIAFATILRLESYGMKAILWRLVVAALLINFSLVIGGVIIDGSNVLTRFFLQHLPGIDQWGISGFLYSKLKVDSIHQIVLGQSKIFSADIGVEQVLGNMILGTIFLLVTAFVFFAAAILFFIRLVALWILLIFAPLAWLAMILPATRSLWNKWWQEFGKWVIFAPVFAFFIYLTTYILDKNILSLPSLPEQQSQALGISRFLSDISYVTNYIILTIFMVAGLIFARSSGIYGATAMVNLGTNMRKGGMRILSRWQAGGAKIPGTGWISQKTGLTDWINRQRATGKGLGYLAATALRAPGATKRFIASKTNRQVLRDAWAEIGRRADEKAFTTPAASVVGMWENFKGAFKGGTELAVDKRDPKTGQRIQKKDTKGNLMFDPITGDPIYEQEIIKTSRLQAFKNIFSDQNVYVEKAKQSLVNKRMQDFSNIKDEETLVHYYQQAKDPQDREALLRLIASMNGLNTLFRSMGRAFGPQEIKKYIQEAFKPEDALRIAADVQSIGYANGNMGYGGMTKFDARLGRNRFTRDIEQDEINLMKFRQMEYQKSMITQHPDSAVGFDASGARVIHSTGRKILGEGYSAEHGEWANRMQPRMKIVIENIAKYDPSIINPDFLTTKQAKDAERAAKAAPYRTP